MTKENAPRARPVSIAQPGHYTLEGEITFVDLMPPLGEEAARIRLSLGPAKILDLPLSNSALVSLSHSLIPKFPPAGWRRTETK
jgi:hypothetical protein